MEWRIVLFSVLAYIQKAESQCESGQCIKSAALNSSLEDGGFMSTDECDDLKTYLHCVSERLDGCVGNSTEKTLLRVEADAHYLILMLKCDYFYSNGICDVADCPFIADVSNGYTEYICNQMNMYVQCMQMEVLECGTGTIYGVLVQSELDSNRLNVEQHCDSTRPGQAVVSLVVFSLSIFLLKIS